MQKSLTRAAVSQFLLDYFIPILIALGASIVLFNRAAVLANPNGDIFYTFHALSDGLENYYDFSTAWKPRIFSNALAALCVYGSKWILTKTSVPMVRDYFDLAIASWTWSWFLAICLSWIIFQKRNSLLYIFGTFTAISFGFISRTTMAVRIYPWDMPALFFFTIFVILFSQKKYWWIFALLPIGMGFKETVFILCISFLFAEYPWKQRLLMVAGSALLCILMKIGIDLYTHAPVFFTMQTAPNPERDEFVYLFSNLNSYKEVLPFFINSGTLLAFYLLPHVEKNILYLKLISIPFILGNLIYGNLIEYRIWYEMIPFALYSFHSAINAENL